MLPVEICERARLARDPRFDGLFFIAVLTTGIYCRPICPARIPAEQNVRYFRTAAAAQDAGYRPCLRCRPDQAATLPTYAVGSLTVIRGLSLINGGMLNEHPVSALADRLGVGVRQLNRLFHDELGAPPKSIARMQRAALARQLIDGTAVPFAEVAHAAGYRSLRRFNDEILAVYRRSPRELRTHPDRGSSERVELKLPIRQPYPCDWVMAFLARRQIEGLEVVEEGVYRRRLPAMNGTPAWLEARIVGNALHVSMPTSAARDSAASLGRLRRIFDLDADPEPVARHLATSERLAPLVALQPGIRVPGAWDGFELAVRAILGQQVSVERATRLTAKLIETTGDGKAFPSADLVARENPAAIGIPGTRGRAIQELARRVANGDIDLTEAMDATVLRASLRNVPGIGPWTAEYIALRAGRDPDAFPDSDWVVLKVLGTTATGARKLAEAWRPWRAYALMYLWLGASRAKLEEN
jgi:AraC family transcriptional regulator of adaptative response / DNA-3-methyladenine glycosylase II